MANTKSIDLERGDSQFLSSTNANLEANFPGKGYTGDISIEMWIKLETLPSTPNDTYRLMAKSSDASGNYSFLFYLTNADDLAFIYTATGTTSGWNTFSTTGTLFDSGDLATWVHIAITVDVSTKKVRFFKGGSFIEEITGGGTATSIYNGTGEFRIGNFSTSHFDGMMDEIAIWSELRSDTEIGDFYNSGDGLIYNGDETSLEGYWRLEDDLLDTTANDNDLTWNYSSGSSTPVYSTSVPFVGSGSPYTLVIDTMALAFTYNAVLLKAARKLIADTMALSFTFNNVGLISGLRLVIDTMALTFTYNAVLFKRSYTLVVDTMALAFTFNAVLLKRALKLVIDTMALVFTFADVVLKSSAVWTNKSRNSTSYTNEGKNSTSWTNKNKS